MFLIALFGVALLFGLLFVGRLGAARRQEVMRQWPAVLLAAAALLFVLRGSVRTGLVFAALAAVSWFVTPLIEKRRRRRMIRPDDPADADARAILGVGPTATESEIRAAYRSKMAQAHPDRGGGHAEAARLTAARDRLLRRRR